MNQELPGPVTNGLHKFSNHVFKQLLRRLIPCVESYLVATEKLLLLSLVVWFYFAYQIFLPRESFNKSVTMRERDEQINFKLDFSCNLAPYPLVEAL